jgi:glyoxalase family protein
VERWGETRIGFRDPDGLPLEIVEAGEPPFTDGGPQAIPQRFAISGFRSAILHSRRPERTAEILTLMGFRQEGESGGRMRMAAGQPGRGSVVEILTGQEGPEGRMGAGAVHHIAWRASDEAAQGKLRGRITGAGLQATEVIDRTYFKSVYFHEPGGILFEIATDPPGFTVDEPLESLGTRLKLPPWMEGQRALVERALPPLGQASPAAAGESRTQ